MRIVICLFLILFSIGQVFSQEESWFYFRAKDTTFLPSFEKRGNYLQYTGNDASLKEVLNKYKISSFKKTWKHAKKENLKKTFFVIADKKDLLRDLLQATPHLFEFGELIGEEDKKIFEPNDYGLTSTIGDNLGAQVNLDYLDFLEVPKAWYYTTGSKDIIIGISDGTIDASDTEFKGKSKIIQTSNLAKGHGYSIAAIAAANGDNAYGTPGVCYGCSIYATNYSNHSSLEQLLELCKMGVKVINCSWGTTKYYETAQQAIYEMLENGTVVVAIGHNKDFTKSKGKLLYYPASYDKVISVSSGNHRYENYWENIKIEMPKNLYYVENIRYYVGRTAGFKNNDTTQESYIYPISIQNINPAIDILGPSIGVFRYSEKILHNTLATTLYGQTSEVAPLITGSIGLMFSLYPCLPADEVESIIKMTATNIDHIKPNEPYKGLYGAGMLNTGRAVEMVYDMFSEKTTVKIENQNFNRWDFKLTALSDVRMQNQTFSDSSSLALTSKKAIVISGNTVLKPNKNGNIHLKINSDLKKECDLRFRDPSLFRE